MAERDITTDNERPFVVTTCDGIELGRATEEGAKWAREKGATVRDTRKSALAKFKGRGDPEDGPGLYRRKGDGDGDTNLMVTSHRSSGVNDGLMFRFPVGNSCGMTREVALKLASDIFEHFGETGHKPVYMGIDWGATPPSEHPLPDWVDANKVYEFKGARYTPNGEYRKPTSCDVWVDSSDEQMRHQGRVAGDIGPYAGIGNRIILKRVSDNLPDWVNREKVYRYNGADHKPHEYRELQPFDVFVCDSDPDRRSQQYALNEDGSPVCADGRPRIILKEVSE